MDIEEIIERTVKQTIMELNEAERKKKPEKSAVEKTIELLESYNDFKMSTDPNAQKLLEQIDDALKMIQSDPYYEIIPMRFFDHMTIWDISGFFDVSEKTIVRRRKKLVRKLSCILFASDVIREILS